MKVLIVEDTKTIATLLRIYLMALGVPLNVFHALDGKQGLRMAQESKPDLIISDVQMPEMDGFQLCGAIRAIPEFMSTPFIFLTSLKETEMELKGRSVGGTAFLHKPLTPQGLRDCLGSFIQLPPQS